MNENLINLRNEISLADLADVEQIVRSTGFFREDEILVALELVRERLDKGLSSGYEFVFVELNGKPVAYACYGLIPCSLVSYDLYWIVTHRDHQGKGLGRKLMLEVESRIAKAGGLTIYVETSSKEMYKSTRAFYLSNDYILKAQFEDFYDRGDDKLVYIKRVS
jgi:GNAT superfamily N-acetyltransferase